MTEYFFACLNEKEKKTKMKNKSESGSLKWHHLVTPATHYEWLHISIHEGTFVVWSFVEQPGAWQ